MLLRNVGANTEALRGEDFSAAFALDQACVLTGGLRPAPAVADVADEPPRNGRLLPVKRAGACTAEVRGSNPLRSTRKSARIALGSMKGVGRIYQQTFIDTSAKVALTRYAHVETGAT